MKNRILNLALTAIICITAGVLLGGLVWRYLPSQAKARPDIEGLLWPNPRQIQSFTVTDQQGKNFSMENLSGKWSFLFFGYTHCPDICPITLSVLNQFHEKLVAGRLADDTQIIFVSVDPVRDTPDAIAKYVAYFNKNFIGLTGTEEQIAGLTQQLGVISIRNQGKGDYTVDHSASVFLISPSRHWIALFSAPQQADGMLARFTAIRDFIAKEAG